MKIIRLVVLAAALGAGQTLAGPATAIDNAWELAPLVLKDLRGQERRLYDWHGRVILLNFWATWCGPCQVEVPHLIDYQTRYAPRGLQVVSVGLDEARKLKNFVRSTGINYPVLVTSSGKGASLMREWGNRQSVLPYTVVIDRDGHLVFMRQGIFDDEAFRAYVLPRLDPANAPRSVSRSDQAS
jgi:thiol-disulfide isomerase/thioredoxin